MTYKPLNRENIAEAVRIHARVGHEREIRGAELDTIVTDILHDLQDKGLAEPRMGIVENTNVKMLFPIEYHPDMSGAMYAVSFHPNDHGLQPILLS